MMTLTREACLVRDDTDALAALRMQFAMEALDAAGVIYLDGNSLGVLPKATAARVRQVIEHEWGFELIRSWNTAGWITLAQRVGSKIAPLVGAGANDLIVTDSTSVNLFKALNAAIALTSDYSNRSNRSDRDGSSRILSERTNFPTDLYIADTVARTHGFELILADSDEIPARIASGDYAIVLLTEVNYRTGHRHDLPALTRAAHQAGALAIWDLAHSAGAMPVQLDGHANADDNADFAIGCGYKYLNGGPGAPAFIWAHPRHLAHMDREAWRQPLSGWMGHAAPFAFNTAYEPAPGIARFLCGTPPVLSLAALECGIDTLHAADAHGGLAAIRTKSLALTDLFITLVESRCAGHGLTLVTPRDHQARGSQVSFAHAPIQDRPGGYEIMQALISRNVIGDFRAPDILRFGFTPLYTRFVDVWDAVDRLHQVLTSGEWQDPRFSVRAAVT